MKSVASAAAVGLAAVLYTAPAFADPVPPAIPQSITLRAPKQITFDQGQVVIVLPQRQITDLIFGGILNSICFSAHQGADWGKIPVREIYVLNEFAVQGWVFEGGAAECREWLSKPAGEDKIYRAAHVHPETCTRGTDYCLGRKK